MSSKHTMKDFSSEPTHNKQTITICGPDDMIDAPLKDAEAFAKKILKDVSEVKSRGKPPCVGPYLWEGKEFAETYACDGKGTCSGFLAAHEFYPSEMVKLRDWLNKAIDYHMNNNCPELKEKGYL